jgi:hypothetical protein
MPKKLGKMSFLFIFPARYRKYMPLTIILNTQEAAIFFVRLASGPVI